MDEGGKNHLKSEGGLTVFKHRIFLAMAAASAGAFFSFAFLLVRSLWIGDYLNVDFGGGWGCQFVSTQGDFHSTSGAQSAAYPNRTT